MVLEMISLPGYKILEQIEESTSSAVYRGIRGCDDRPVILKVLKSEYPTPLELERYQQEYEILQTLDIEGVVKVYGLESDRRTIALILEDFGGRSLSHWMRNRSVVGGELSLDRFLQLAIEIVEILGRIHDAGVIHKDINLANIGLNPQTGTLKILDFSISTLLEWEDLNSDNLAQLQGTLAYISPEQTGRTNRAIDYRTDFYSLGVTFYQLLSGRLPFVSTDFLEIVHYHLAKQPPPLAGEIPAGLTDIVMKLMAKNPDDRYQSAWGIRADLGKCQQQFAATGTIDRFVLGREDFCDRFRLPHKLYGREAEIQSILNIFNWVTCPQDSAISANVDRSCSDATILISGDFGVGKSALLQEVFTRLTSSNRSSCLRVQCDPVRANVPYSTMVDILRELARQLLTESQSRIERCRQQLLRTIEHHKTAIVNAIPEFKAILGVSEENATLESMDLPDYNHVFPHIFQILTTTHLPLAIFLDDWQWIDPESLKIVFLLMLSSKVVTPELEVVQLISQNGSRSILEKISDSTSDRQQPSRSILWIGTCGTNEDCPLLKSLKNIEQAEVPITRIVLSPLKNQAISKLLADLFHRDWRDLKSLAKVVFRKTGGNPFFVREFLRKLHDNKIIYFDREVRNWQWNIQAIEATNLTENLLEVTIANLQKLPNRTQKLLGLAACIGVSFDLNTLSEIANSPPADIFKNLLPALKSEAICTTSNSENCCLGSDLRSYKFGHDRIHQLAYHSLEELSRKETHLKIGRFWSRATLAWEWIDLHLFKIANQFYLGVDCIANDLERQEVARLQMQAGRKAKFLMNLETALDYLNRGLAVLEFNFDSSIASDLQEEISEIESWQSFFEQSDTVFNLSLEFFAQGKNLEDLKRDIDRYLSIASIQDKLNETLSYIQLLREDLGAFSGESIAADFEKSQTTSEVEYSSFKSSTLLAKYQVFKCQLYLLQNRIDEALYMARSVSKSIDYILNSSLAISYLFYYSLTLLEIFPSSSELQRQTFFKQIEINRNQMQLWLERYPEEVGHKISLIEAEIHRISDRFIEAMDAYDRTIDLARSNQSIHEEALACERAGFFYLNWGKEKIAQTYFKEAHYAYTRWGAIAKVRDLERQYPKLLKSSFPKSIADPYETTSFITTSTESSDSALDLATVMKASRAISQEICLERFLTKSIEILIENAGAQRGFLIVPSRDDLEEDSHQFYIVAQSQIEGETKVLESIPLDGVLTDGEIPLVSSAIVNYVARTQKSIVLDRADREGDFTTDFYIQQAGVQSVLCDPLLYQGQLVGVVYLENNLISAAFTPERLQVVRLLSQQAAIALENARLYERLEEYSHSLEVRVERRTQELQQEIFERQLLENRLRSEERKMRAIFEAMTDIILIIKMRSDNCIETIEISPTAPTRSSSLEQSLIQKTIDRFYEENNHWQVPIQQVLETQKTINFDYALQFNNESIWFTASISPIPGGSVIWVARNITDRVLAEEALRLSEETFSKSFRASPSAMTITRLADGRHVEVNETFCTLTGYAPEDLIGHTALDLNLWVNSQDRQNLFNLLQTDGIVRNYEFDFRTKSGKILTALLSVEIVRIRGEDCLLAISNDITERKRAEKELQHKNEELALTLQKLQTTQNELIQSEKMASLGQLIAGVAHEINTPMGAIRASIENSSQALDRTLQDLPKLFQTLSPERIADFLALLEESERQYSQKSILLSFREQRKIKRALRDELETRGFENADTLAATLVSLGIDCEIDRFMPILQDRDRDSILDTAENLSILKKSSDNIKLAVDRASKIVFALKSYSRQDCSGNMTQFSISEGIDLVLTIYQNQLKRGVETIKHYERVAPIYCFPEELNQVWTNLIHNAIQAMNNRGTLNILVSQKDDFVLAEFTDSGKGISPEIQDKIFDPFFTTKPPGEGSGLGLNIVRKIIDKHRGKIEVASQPGRTTFSVWLPVNLP